MALAEGLDPDVQRYYERGREGTRLATASRLEHVRTRELLTRTMPAPPARVLDVGGGTGVYARWLRGRGYDVTLIDPVPLHVEAAANAGVPATLGDARLLARDSRSADVVLLLGPLYHLPEWDERRQALREAHRVLKPGGLLLVAAITRYASTYDGLVRGFLAEPGFERIVEADVTNGRHRNPEDHPGWFTTAFFHHPDQFRVELAETGFAVESVVAVEGPGAVLPDVDAWLDDPARRERLLRAIRRVEREPSLLGASPHLLGVAHRPA